MAFVYAYSLDGDAAGVVKDYAMDTSTNYINGSGSTVAPNKGDLVFLNAGLVRKAVAATASGSAIGVAEGGEFIGLVAQGQPYAATNSSFTASSINTTKNPNGVVKVRNDKAAMVFKVPVNSGSAANANIGVAYGIAVTGTGDQKVDLTNTTTTHVKVVDYTPDGSYVFVTLV